MAKKVTITFKNPVNEAYIDHMEVWWKLGVGGTYAQLGSDIAFVVGTADYSVEDTSGNVADSANLYYEVRAYNDNGGQVEGTDYNKLEANITISSTAALPTGSILALPSDVNNPTDLSATARTSAALAGYSLPVNSGGLNAFDGIGTHMLELSSTALASSVTARTLIFAISFDSLSTPASTTGVFGTTGFNFGITNTGALYIVVGIYTVPGLTAITDYMSAGVVSIVTVIQDTDATGTYQFDEDTPISLGTPTLGDMGIREFGGWDGQSRYLTNKIGRIFFTNSLLTGQDLIDAKAWVADY